MLHKENDIEAISLYTCKLEAKPIYPNLPWERTGIAASCSFSDACGKSRTTGTNCT